MQPKFSSDHRRKVLELSRVSPFRYISAALTDWLIIAASIACGIYYGSLPVYLAAAFLIATRQHAFMILVHDATHYRAHRKPFINDCISDLLCAYPIFFDTAIYRHRHLQHHDQLNTDKDPDWVRKVPFAEWHFPQTKGQFAKHMAAYILFKGTLEWLYATWYFSGFSKAPGLPRSFSKIASKAVFWTMVAGTLTYLNGWFYFAAYWVIPFYCIFPTIQRIRSIAEHFGVSYSNDWNQSRDITPSKLEAFLLAPHGVHWHLSHHLYPPVPFHNLKQLHQTLMEDPVFAQESKQNTSYLMPSARSLWKDIIARSKTPSSAKPGLPESKQAA